MERVADLDVFLMSRSALEVEEHVTHTICWYKKSGSRLNILAGECRSISSSDGES